MQRKRFVVISELSPVNVFSFIDHLPVGRFRCALVGEWIKITEGEGVKIKIATIWPYSSEIVVCGGCSTRETVSYAVQKNFPKPSQVRRQTTQVPGLMISSLLRTVIPWTLPVRLPRRSSRVFSLAFASHLSVFRAIGWCRWLAWFHMLFLMLDNILISIVDFPRIFLFSNMELLHTPFYNGDSLLMQILISFPHFTEKMPAFS